MRSVIDYQSILYIYYWCWRFSANCPSLKPLKVLPGGHTFQPDMLHSIPILADFELIHQRGQTLIKSNAHCDNCHHIYQDYEFDWNSPSEGLQSRRSWAMSSWSIYYWTSWCEWNSHNPMCMPNVYEERINIRQVRPYTQAYYEAAWYTSVWTSIVWVSFKVVKSMTQLKTLI
jgi:hypothetical protein